jgi:hypothetical protein
LTCHKTDGLSLKEIQRDTLPASSFVETWRIATRLHSVTHYRFVLIEESCLLSPVRPANVAAVAVAAVAVAAVAVAARRNQPQDSSHQNNVKSSSIHLTIPFFRIP